MDAETFQAGIDFLKDNDPENIWIKDFERKGFSFVNWKHMQKQLSKVDNINENQSVPAESPKKEKAKINDSILEDLYGQKNILFRKRSEQSNKFHQVKTNKGRATISDAIHSIQNEIKKKMIDIENYKISGTIPKNYNNKYPIPRSSLEKYKLLGKLRVRISNKKAHIRKLVADLILDDYTRESRLNKANAKLSFLNTYKNHVETSIGKKGR